MVCLTEMLNEEEEERNAEYGVDDGHQLIRQTCNKYILILIEQTFPSLVLGVWSPYPIVEIRTIE